MNGLQAIEAMMAEGKIVVAHYETNDWIYRFKDGNIHMKELGEPLWRIAFGFDFDRNYEIFGLVEGEETGWHDAEHERVFYTMDWEGMANVEIDADAFEYEDEDRFSTPEKVEEIASKQRMFRKLQRFSDMHGGNKINWKDGSYKYYIYFDYETEHWKVESTINVRDFGQVYFISMEVAKKAIMTFGIELINYFYNELESKHERN